MSEGVAYEVITSGSHRIAARTLIVDGATDQVYLCTTTQTTPRDLTYIKEQADTIGGTFIELTAMIPTTWKGAHIIGQDYEAGDRVTTNANTRIYTARVDTDETPPHADWIQVGPVGSGISWGFQIDTLIVPELNQDAISDARIVLEDSGLTHYLTFLDWTAANLDTISHLPVGAHIGLRQGTTIRILRVEAVWDSTNNRYQVTNVNAGGILEEASGTATELLLTAGVSGGGFTLRFGTTAPGNSLGDDGDWYLRTSNGQWYEKVSGAWESRYTDMVGQAGSGITQTQGDARYARQSENLNDLDDTATARTNLGLGTAATRDTGTAENNVPILDASGDLDATVIPESVRGVKVVETVLPAPSAVADDDRVKLHVVKDSNNLVSEVAHLATCGSHHRGNDDWRNVGRPRSTHRVR